MDNSEPERVHLPNNDVKEELPDNPPKRGRPSKIDQPGGSDNKPKGYVKIKSEETQVRVVLNHIIESPVATDLIKEQAERRINATKSFNHFSNLKNDLQRIIKDERLQILTHTAVSPVSWKTKNRLEDPNQIEFSLHWNKSTTDKSSKTISRAVSIEQMTEHQYLALFQSMIDIIKNNLDNFNKLESKAILKLIEEVKKVVSEKYDHNSTDQYFGLEIFTSRENLDYQIALQNEYVDDWIQRKKIAISNNQDFAKIIEDDLDNIIQNKLVIIPSSFSLTKSIQQNKHNYELKLIKTYNKIKLMKCISIDANNLDLFLLYKLCYTWLEQYKERLDDIGLGQLLDKVNQAKLTLDNIS